MTGAERQRLFVKKLRDFEIHPMGHPERRGEIRRLMHLCRGEVRDLKDAGYTINTVKTYLTDYRAAIQERLDAEEQKWALKYLNLTNDEWWDLRNAYDKKVTADASKTRAVQVEPMIAAAKDALHSQSYSQQAAALMFLTGRRSVEILKMAEFSAVPGKSDHVMFEGQAKTRAEAQPYEIPVIGGVKAHDVIVALKELRAKRDFSELEADEVNAKTAKTMSETVERVFGADEEGNKIKPKDLRAIYRVVAIRDFKPIDKGQNVFVAEILGHRTYETTEAGRASFSAGTLNRNIADSYEDFHLVQGSTKKELPEAGHAPEPAAEDGAESPPASGKLKHKSPKL